MGTIHRAESVGRVALHRCLKTEAAAGTWVALPVQMAGTDVAVPVQVAGPDMSAAAQRDEAVCWPVQFAGV